MVPIKKFLSILLVVFYFTISFVAGFALGKLIADYRDESNTVYSVEPLNKPVPSVLAGNNETELAPERRPNTVVSHTPEYGTTLPQPPKSVEITFNRELYLGSMTYVQNGARDFGKEEIIISDDKLTMTRNVWNYLPNGLITVNYTACYKDRSCDQGSFQFFLNRPAGN